ncbi:hypothetical protein QM996_24345 (plasmid) [Sinorhizobium chiapasense]|uniref:hypothetical protein n=1 Tax=Sinorhizobium chiapasense TaxID=501572 RepID=UPI002FE24819
MTGRIFDCFTFFNELEVLEARLHELYEFVDYFVIVESTVTFKNHKKPLFFQDNKDKFTPFLDKILHVVVYDSPDEGSPWVKEYHQRNAIRRGLPELDDSDIIIISDVDEIVRSETVAILRSISGYAVLDMSLHFYFFNMVYATSGWRHAFAVTGRYFETIRDLSDPRKSPQAFFDDFAGPKREILRAGWHFSYLGGAERIRTKVNAYSHTGELVDAINRENAAEEMLRDGRWPNSPNVLRLSKIDENMPKYIRTNERQLMSAGLVKCPWDRIAELEALVDNQSEQLRRGRFRRLTVE